MTLVIADKRTSQSKAAENRSRFLERAKKSIKEAIPDILENRSLKDIGKQSEKVKVRKNQIKEPSIVYGTTGSETIVHPGNKKFIPGDTIAKPNGGGASGGAAPASGTEAPAAGTATSP